VGKAAKNEFDPNAFLAGVGAGKAILKFEKNQHVFKQGDTADAAFTFKKVGSSSLSCRSRVRKRSSEF
jgi:CRP/FNR family transcriptional regulator, cyclic AMP receptor protein